MQVGIWRHQEEKGLTKDPKSQCRGRTRIQDLSQFRALSAGSGLGKDGRDFVTETSHDQTNLGSTKAASVGLLHPNSDATQALRHGDLVTRSSKWLGALIIKAL